MGGKDDRNAEEQAAWQAGEFTADEAAAAGMTQAQMNQIRAVEERAAGNELAPQQ